VGDPGDLTATELLTTTRTVRRRIDFDRPVPMNLVEACLEIALQAPSGSNRQGWQFVVVNDAAKRLALAELYRRAWTPYAASRASAGSLFPDDPARAAVQGRVHSSAEFLAMNLERVPVHLIPTIAGRPEGRAAGSLAAFFGSILPATWSFCLAARSRGLATAFTTMHLAYEREAADLLGIPFDDVTQVGLIPVGYLVGDTLHPAAREPLASVIHVNSW
jgi:nitroreductase